MPGLLLLLLLAGLQPARAATVDRIAAVVDGDAIALSEVYDLGGDFIEQRVAADPAARRQAELDVLDELIRRALVDRQVDDLDLEVTDEDLDRAIGDIARQNAVDPATLRHEVEQSGLSWEHYRDELRQQLRQMKFNQVVLQPRITVTEDELRDRYQRKARDAPRRGARELDGILLRWPDGSTPDSRQRILDRLADAARRLRGGESWESVAADFPDSLYAGAGGRMGAYRPGELVDELGGPAFSMIEGQVSDPIELQSGAAILRVERIRPGEMPPFEQVRDELETELRQEHIQEEMDLWVAQARRKASVEILLESP